VNYAALLDMKREYRAADAKVRRSTRETERLRAQRDRIVRRMYRETESLRTVAALTGLSHTAVAKVLDR